MCTTALCCAGEAFCCAGAMCCGCLCKIFSCCGVHQKTFSKIGYVFFDLFFLMIAFILMYSTQTWFDIFPSSMECPEASGSGFACFGISFLARTTFVLMCFHLLIFIMILPRNTFVAMFHDGCWALKFFLVGSAIFGTLYINNSFFQGYLEFCRYVSLFFLIYQALLMLIVSYKINDVLVGNYERSSSTCSAAIIIGVTAIFTLINIIWMIYQFIWFGKKGCQSNLIIMIFTLIFGLFFYIIVIFRTRPDASLLTSSIVFLYNLYLQWSAMASDTNTYCNPFGYSTGYTATYLTLGLLFTITALVIIAASTKNEEKSNIAQKVNEVAMEDENEGERLEDIEEKGGKQMDQEKMHVFPISKGTIIFQFILILAAIYYTMLLSNWGNPTIIHDTTDFFESNKSSYWVKMVALWISILVYLFSMLGPIIFPNREF